METGHEGPEPLDTKRRLPWSDDIRCVAYNFVSIHSVERQTMIIKTRHCYCDVVAEQI